MMEYLVVAYDKENVLDKRLAVRDEHIANTKELMEKGNILQAGAIMENEKMIGSSLFVSFESEKSFYDWLENEPYAKNGVWDMDEIKIVPLRLLK